MMFTLNTGGNVFTLFWGHLP